MSEDNKPKEFSKLGKTGRQELAKIIPLNRPFTLFIEPSNACNFKCIHCPHGLEHYGRISGPVKNMSMECFDKLVRDLISWRERLNLTGDEKLLKVIRIYLEGESLMNPQFCDMVRILKENDLAERMELTTNGSIMSAEISGKLVEYGLDYLRVSIYAMDETKHMETTKSNVTPKDILENIKLLKKIREEKNSQRPFIQVKMIDTKDKDELDLFKSTYESVADEVFVDIPMNWNGANGVDFIENIYKDSSQKEMVMEEIHENEVDRNACPYPFHTMAVKSNGEIVVCCVDWLRKTNIGNINAESLADIWNGKRMYEFRKMHLTGQRHQNESCKDCESLKKLPKEDSVDGVDIEKIK